MTRGFVSNVGIRQRIKAVVLALILLVLPLPVEDRMPLNDLDLLRKLITEHPDRGNLPVELVMAICRQESSLNDWHFYRPEPAYRWLVGNPTEPKEIIGQKSSWGPMQVMGATARELGFTGEFSELFDYATGIKYGMLYLRKLNQRYDNWPDVISAYNAGHVKRVDGKYANQVKYVDPVLRYWNELETHIELKGTEV